MSNKNGAESIAQKVVRIGIIGFPRLIIGSLILVGIAINFANVVGRYVFLSPVIWAEEIMIFIMVWTVFIGAVAVSWDGRHLKMDFFSIMLPSPWKQMINFIATAAFVTVCIFVLPQAYTVVEMMLRFDQRSVVAEIPMVIPHFAILLGFTLMLIAVAVRFRRHVAGDLLSEADDLVADYSEADGPEGGNEGSPEGGNGARQ